MARVLTDYFDDVWSSDIHDYGYGHVADFLDPVGAARWADWIITNPPFRLGEQFALTALDRARVGVALFVRTAFLESVGRYGSLFKPHPPAYVFQFTERVPLFRGRLNQHGSTATAYCWVVWLKLNAQPRSTVFRWIPPCRKALEREGDYD